MHFKLDLKEKKMLMKKKKSGENGTFKKNKIKIRPLPCPFFCCFGERDASVCSIYGEMEGRLEKCFREANLECL